MQIQYSFLFILILIIMSACQQNSRTSATDGSAPYQPMSEFELKVQYPSGSILPESILKSKVPTLFNVGELSENVFGMMLGASLPKNSLHHYVPIGVYTMMVDSTDLAFVLCKQDEDSAELIQADSYHEWSLQEIQYKNLIDHWFKTNCELSDCKSMQWANDLKALRILERVK